MPRLSDVTSNDVINSSVSIVRVVSDALVREPTAWKWIIKRGVDHANGLGEDSVGAAALGVMESELDKLKEPPTRETIQEIAQKLVDGSEPPQLSKLMSPEALAGQSLMLSLRR